MYDSNELIAPTELSIDAVRRRDHVATEEEMEELSRLKIAFRYAKVLLPVVQMKADVYLRQN